LYQKQKTNFTVMKNLKSLFTIFAIATVFASSSYAQSDDVIVTADVLAAISIATDNDLVFGDLVQSTAATVDPQGTANVGLLETPTYGQATITGTGTYDVDITLSTAAFNLSNGTNTISFAPLYSGDGVNTNQATSTDLTTNGVNTVTLVAGSYTVWVGGTIGDTGTNSGTFTSTAGDGDITISVSYN
jgi:hypothetical protein